MATAESYWGHHGPMRAVGAPEPPPADRRPGGPALRAPVYVIDGNYQRMHGVCPWWDAMKAAR
jgi:hypothetical protein